MTPLGAARSLILVAALGGCIVVAPPPAAGPAGQGWASYGAPPPPPPAAYAVQADAAWTQAATATVEISPQASSITPQSVSQAGTEAPVVLGGRELGMFRVGYAPSANPALDEIRKVLEREQVFDTVARELNRRIRMPRQLDIQLTDCGTINAFYDPASARIIMCWEFYGYLAQTFQGVVKDKDELGNAIVGASFFAFYHELGHALRDQLDIPMTGREEDAVDQLATLILLDDETGSVAAALAGARWFLLNAQARGKDAELPFWDEHSLDEQRFFDIACLIYGSNPTRHADLAKVIPEKRAVRCSDEHRKISSAWSKLLAPHMIPASERGPAVAAVDLAATSPTTTETTPAPPIATDDDTLDPDDVAASVSECEAVIATLFGFPDAPHLDDGRAITRATLAELGVERMWDEQIQTCEDELSPSQRRCVLAADSMADAGTCE